MEATPWGPLLESSLGQREPCTDLCEDCCTLWRWSISWCNGPTLHSPLLRRGLYIAHFFDVGYAALILPGHRGQNWHLMAISWKKFMLPSNHPNHRLNLWIIPRYLHFLQTTTVWLLELPYVHDVFIKCSPTCLSCLSLGVPPVMQQPPMQYQRITESLSKRSDVCLAYQLLRVCPDVFYSTYTGQHHHSSSW